MNIDFINLHLPGRAEAKTSLLQKFMKLRQIAQIIPQGVR